MGTSDVADALPPLYQPWIAALLGAPPSGEARATCDACVMLSRPGAPPPPIPFHPAVKCCTYYPMLPNFLVGGVLSAGDSPALRILEERLQARLWVTPLGIDKPPEYRLLYETSTRQAGVFGRVPRLRCPFYVDGKCGIWRHRNGTCATWFCVHEHAVRGKLFWELLRRLLRLVEHRLVLHALRTLPLGADAVDYLVAVDPSASGLDQAQMNHTLNPQLYRLAWGRYVGRERQFFVESAELVAKLAWPEVLALGGAEVALLARALRDSFAAQSARPERVRRSGARGQMVAADKVRMSAQPASYDQIDVPVSALRLLPRLEGQRLDDALRTLADEGQPLDPALVDRLLDFEILIPDGD
jgi:hypothetical protein